MLPGQFSVLLLDDISTSAVWERLYCNGGMCVCVCVRVSRMTVASTPAGQVLGGPLFVQLELGNVGVALL